MKKLWLLVFVLLPVAGVGQVITTFAGNGAVANTGDGGPATLAGIDYPAGCTFDKYGNFYFTTGVNGRSVRKINIFGIISKIAGTGSSGYSGDGEPQQQQDL